MSVKVIDSFRLVVAKKGATNIGYVEADADNDTLTLEAGVGIGLQVDEANDKITIINESDVAAVLAARAPIYLRADDSVIKEIGPGENFGLLGTGAASTASNAEGDVTINVPLTLSSYTNDPGFITGNNLGDRADVTITSVSDNELLQYDNGTSQWVNRTLAEAGFAAVSTSGSYNDLTNRPNLTFDGDVSGSTGGALAGGASTITITLDDVGIVAGTYNGFTIDSKGRVTAVNPLLTEDDTLQSVTDRGTSTTNAITVAGLRVGNYDLPRTLGSDGTILKVLNGNLQFLSASDFGSLQITADDSVVRTINSGEILEVAGAGTITTASDAEGKLTITGPTNISAFSNDSNYLAVGDNISNLSNDARYMTELGVAGDDSVTRYLGAGEIIKFIGSGNVSTATDTEGNLTITSAPTIQDVITNGNIATTSVDFQDSVTLGSDTNDNLIIKARVTQRFPLYFDGATAGGSYTRFEIEDPTGNRTITFPDATGTIAFTGANISTFNNDLNYITNTGSTTGNAGTATALQTPRDFSISGVITASAVSFDATGNVVLNTTFTNNNISQFVNDEGYAKNAVQVGDNITDLANNANFMSKWFIGADDSAIKQVNGDETIKIMGSGAATTASDAEGNITVTVSNNLSDFNNDAGFNTQNDTITLTGDVSGTGRTTINTTLNLALSDVIPGTYNSVTVDTKGIVQDATLEPYVKAGTGVSQLQNDAGYITSLGTSLRFVGDDSTGFGVPIPGNDIRFQGENGVTVSAANEVITISGPLDSNGLVVADIKGSVFGDDSQTIIQGDTGYITTPVATISQFIQMNILTTAPTSPANGMVAIADGSGWDPLGNGVQSMVVYLNNGWRQIAVA